MTDRERAICRRLKQFREQIRWPQSDFAHELGITRDKLASMEYERSPLTYGIGYRICAMFDVNAEWLSTGQGVVSPSDGMATRIPPGNLPERTRFSEAMDSQPQGSAVADAENRKHLSDPANQWQFGDEDYVERWLKRAVEVVSASRFSAEAERQEFARRCERLLTSLTLAHQRKHVAQQVRSTSAIGSTFPRYSGASAGQAMVAAAFRTALEEVETWVSLIREEVDATPGATPPPDPGQYRKEFQAAAGKLSELLAGKSSLDELSNTLNPADMVKTVDELLDDVKNKTTGQHGAKSALAGKLGIAPQQLNDWLTKRSNPSGAHVLQLLQLGYGNRGTNKKGSGSVTALAEPVASKESHEEDHCSKPGKQSPGRSSRSTSQRRKGAAGK